MEMFTKPTESSHARTLVHLIQHARIQTQTNKSKFVLQLKPAKAELVKITAQTLTATLIQIITTT